MKKIVFLLLLLAFMPTVLAKTSYNVDEATHKKYVAELKNQGWLYGCNPPNWSIIEPVRGGFNYAVQKNRADILELQVKAGLDPASCTLGKTNMAHFATRYKNDGAALKFLVKNGVNPNAEGFTHTPLTMAIYYKNPIAVGVLLENGADPNFAFRDIAPLNYALKKKNTEIIKLLLNAGAKPDDKTQKLVEKSKKPEIKELFK